MAKEKTESEFMEEILKANKLFSATAYSRTESNGIIKISYTAHSLTQNTGADNSTSGIAWWVGKVLLSPLVVPLAPSMSPIRKSFCVTPPLIGTHADPGLNLHINKTHFFDGDSKVFLGDTESEASTACAKKGSACLQERKWFEAKSWFEKAKSLNQSNDLYKDKLAEVEAELLNEQGDEKMRQGEYLVAKSLFEEALRIGENYQAGKEKLQENLTQVETIMRESNRAVEFFRTGALGLNEERIRILNEAREALECVRKLAPGNKTFETLSESCRKCLRCYKLLKEAESMLEKGDRPSAYFHFVNAAFELNEMNGIMEDEVVSHVRNQVISFAIDKANNNLAVDNHEGAKDWYRQAILAVRDSKDKSFFEQEIVNVEAELANKQGLELLTRKNFAGARELFEQAKLKCSDDCKGKSKFEENLKTVNSAVTEAENTFLAGETLWNRAWARENEEDVENAEACFQKAESKFQAALKCAPDNEEYKKWSQISRCKIEGNRLFNEGTALQEEGNRRLEQKKYEEAYHKFYEAYNKYQEAKLKFTQGRDLGDSKRFAKCMDMAVGQVEKTKEYKNIAERMRFAACLSSIVKDENNGEINEASALADDIELIGARDA